MALIPDFASLLNDAVGLQASGGATYSGGVRNAMVFTSTLRQRVFQFVPGNERSTGIFDENLFTSQGVPAPRPGTEFVAGDFFKTGRGLLDFITMGINPNSVKFTQPKRWTKKDTREGSVFFHFTNSQGQNNDILTLEFAGNTGNIDRRSSLLQQQPNEPGQPQTVEQDAGALRKILAWHNLYLLTREPMLLPDGSENLFTITYISPLFTQAIDFNGFFNQVLDFEENARKPHSRDYRFEFTVTSTNPGLDELLSIVADILEDTTLQPSATAQIAGPNVEYIGP